MKYVSFSLWGNNPLYNIGAIRNSELIKTIYPDWKMVVYYDKSVPKNTIDELIKNDVNVISMDDSDIFPSFWRFLIADKEDCEYAVFRDCDSRISVREKLAVDEWVNSNKKIHVMRDHPAHRIPFGSTKLGILAGMWGIKGNVIEIENLIREFITNKKDGYGIDQSFLSIIFQQFFDDRYTHDEFFEKKPFPIKRTDKRFIGERINIDETPLTNDHLCL